MSGLVGPPEATELKYKIRNRTSWRAPSKRPKLDIGPCLRRPISSDVRQRDWSLRNTVGEYPVSRRKVEARWLELLNPASAAISRMVSPGWLRSRLCVRATRF